MNTIIRSKGTHKSIEFEVDQFGNRWLKNLYHLNKADCITDLIDFAKVYQDTATIVELDIEYIHVAYWLKASNVGFKHFYTPSDGTKVQWWIPNQSPMPDAFTGISGAFGLIINDRNEVLLIADKYRPGITLPGGSINAHELPHQAYLREIKEEVGLTVNQSQLMSNVYRVNSNRYGANDVINYFISYDWSGDLKIQSSELLWASFVPLDQVLTQTSFFGDRKLSGLTSELLNHIINHPTERKTIKNYDLRQNSKATKDKSDIMMIELYPIHSQLISRV